MKMLRFFFQRKPTPAAPQIFTSVEDFQAALRGHSEVKRCFAWGQHIIEKGRADCIVRAEAYGSLDDYTAPPLFSLVCTVYEGAEWPLPKPMHNHLESIINNITFHVLCQ